MNSASKILSATAAADKGRAFEESVKLTLAEILERPEAIKNGMLDDIVKSLRLFPHARAKLKEALLEEFDKTEAVA